MKKINEAINGAYIADKYSLGTHWMYDQKEIEQLSINWNILNNPQAPWHKNKKAGDFTHYGDHMRILHNFLKDKKDFDIALYKDYWLNEMKTYNGYIDSSTSKTIEIFKNNNTLIGYESSDLSCVGRIAPLLLVSKNKEHFLNYVNSFVSMTHNSQDSLKSAKFFANFLYRVVNGETINDVLNNIEVDDLLNDKFKAGIKSKDKNTSKAILNFGQSCPVDGGFQCVIHLLAKYDNYKDIMLANSRAGGDSSARAMIIGMLMGSANAPREWDEF